MKNKNTIFLLILAVAAILVLLFLYKGFPTRPTFVQSTEASNSNTNKIVTTSKLTNLITSAPAPPKVDIQAEVEEQNREIKQNAQLWRTPLLYYGKVVDENNNPISGVQIAYGGNSVNESLTEEARNEGIVTTDQRGIFKIDGLYGIGLMLQLFHSNYYSYPDNVTGFDVRSRPIDGIIADSEAHARIFHMHSKGNAVPLIFRNGGFHAPNNGSVAYFPLRGNSRVDILGQLQVKGWNNLRTQTYPYDWKVQLDVPDGGILEITNYFDFVAPEAGYSDSVNIEVSGSESVRKTYFLKVPKGFIRLKLEVIMGKDMFVTGDYDFNPDGSRNLEPSQEIRPSQ